MLGIAGYIILKVTGSTQNKLLLVGEQMPVSKCGDVLGHSVLHLVREDGCLLTSACVRELRDDRKVKFQEKTASSSSVFTSWSTPEKHKERN